MKILIACEFSGRIRDAFRERGHDAWSCDLKPSERPGPHIQGDVAAVMYSEPWDMMIAHPPCDHLAVSGSRWFSDKGPEQQEALEFVLMCMNAPIARIAVENPVSVISGFIRKPDQIVHPWEYGHDEQKPTCLWLKNLPALRPTKIVPKGPSVIHALPPSEERKDARSRTYWGIALAMAEQWGGLEVLSDVTPANNRIVRYECRV